MQTYHVKLQSEMSDSYMAKRAADSVDLNLQEKSLHELNVKADIDLSYNIGLVIGNSGSGKTTLAKQIFGEDFDFVQIDENKCIIDQFPEHLDYQERLNILTGIGLSSVPCWIKPIKTLSNGQKARALCALGMSQKDICIIDEFTSVVDRTVAKVMAHCVQKYARKNNKKIILLSCHFDIVEWLNPDWIIDCNKQSYEDRRDLWQSYERQEKLEFTIREVARSTWNMFSKYHYLSDKLAGGTRFFYGIFHEDNQIGFICYTNYVPWADKSKSMILHFNRIVIHPDYAGFGLGKYLIMECSRITQSKGFTVMGKFSSTPVYNILKKDKYWKLLKISRQIGKSQTGKNVRQTGYRENIKTYSFKYLG